MWPDGRGTTYRFVRRRWHVLFAIIDWCGWRVTQVVSRINRRCFHAKTDTSQFHVPRRILVIQLDHLGDAVISLPFLAALRRRFPGSAIEVLCSPWNVGLLQMATGIDRLHVLGWNRFARNWRRHLVFWLPALIHCAWRVRRGRFDLAIDVRGDFPNVALMWLAGCGRRIGWRCAGGGFLLTDSPAYIPRRAEAQSRLAIIELLGAAPTVVKTALLDPGDQARREIERRLSNANTVDRPLVVMHIGAGTKAKCWPPEHWRELIGRLVFCNQVRIILVGNGDDRRHAAQILNANYTFDAKHVGLHDSERLAEDWTGRLSLAELTALMERAAVVVGGDSGPAHLAAAVGTPVVVVFSGTSHAEQWQPAGEQVTVLRQSVACGPCFRSECRVPGHPCMQGLLPAVVVDAIQATFENSTIKPRQGRLDVDPALFQMELGLR